MCVGEWKFVFTACVLVNGHVGVLCVLEKGHIEEMNVCW